MARRNGARARDRGLAACKTLANKQPRCKRFWRGYGVPVWRDSSVGTSLAYHEVEPICGDRATTEREWLTSKAAH